MSEASRIVAYELYVLEYTGWKLHARYPGAERDDALDDAKNIELTRERATKLLRETYYPQTNQTEEAVVRISPNLLELKRKLLQSRQVRNSAADAFAEIDAASLEKGNKPLTTAQTVSRIVGAVASAIAVSAAITGIISLLLRSPIMASRISPVASSQILFGTFLLVFLLSALPLINRYVPKLMGGSDKADAEQKSSHAFLDMPARKPPEAEKPATPPPPQTDEALLDRMPEAKAEPEPQPEPEPEPPKKQKPEPAPEPEPPAAATEDLPEDAEFVPVEEEKPEAAAETVLIAQRMTMMRFLTGLVTALKDSCPQLDPYNKFGLNLIMAGACGALGNRNGLTPQQTATMLREAITMLGTKPTLADAFTRKLDVHMMEPRYAEMALHGEAALSDYLADTGTPFADLNAAMAAWNRPADRVSGSNIVTVMFTDMVGSTVLTQNRGDTAAQDFVRAHNAIVRTALAQHEGSEVKHTGDGIMASFAAPSQSVEAAIAIQKAVAAHNATMPQQELHLRIGINAGEPIVEDDDLFGAAVQTAARICSAAAPDHILIANVVRELVAGKNLPMRALPPQHLRGITEAQVLYDVAWAEAPDPAAVPPATPVIDAAGEPVAPAPAAAEAATAPEPAETPAETPRPAAPPPTV